MPYKITINRCSGVEDVSKENWKDLISALVLCGFDVSGDDETIKFITGFGEIVEEIKE